MKTLLLIAVLAGVALAQTAAVPSKTGSKHQVGEPVPRISEMQEAPEAPQLPPDWAQKMKDRNESYVGERTRVHIFRLRPGDDLMGGIRTYVRANHIQAAVLLSAVGSLTQASIRYANISEAHILKGHFELVSINGTLEEGGEHVHLSISTGQGNVIGGHLLTGCKVYTTAEITLMEVLGARFTREIDKEGSGWDELKIYYAQP